MDSIEETLIKVELSSKSLRQRYNKTIEPCSDWIGEFDVSRLTLPEKFECYYSDTFVLEMKSEALFSEEYVNNILHLIDHTAEDY